MKLTSEQIIAVLGALGAFIGVVFGIVRAMTGERFQRRVTESAALLSGYTDMVKSLRVELTEVKEQHSKDMERQANHHRVEIENTNFLHDEERKRWQTERERLEERIDTLEAQVAALLYRPEGRRTRKDDPGGK